MFEIGKTYRFNYSNTLQDDIRGMKFKIIAKDRIQIYYNDGSIINGPNNQDYWLVGNMSTLKKYVVNLSPSYSDSKLIFKFLNSD